MTSDHSDHPDPGRGALGSSVSVGAARFANFAALVFGYTVLVVIFGAFVRASLSGDGCGTSWPFCNGGVLPVGRGIATVIEYTHRATSGVLMLMVVGLVIWSRRLWPAKHLVRKAAAWSCAFTMISAAIGAILVIFSFVVHDRSLGRAITMPLHLVNTFLLMGALTMTVYWARGGAAWSFRGVRDGVGSALKWAFGGMFALGMTGAISAMGKTAFSTELKLANTFFERVMMHIGEDAHPVLRGGVMHPLLAMAVGLMVILAARLAMERREGPGVRLWANWTVGLYLFQMVFGTANLLMSAPQWMQLVHLALALANWTTLVMLAACALRLPLGATPAADTLAVVGTGGAPGEKVGSVPLLKAYVALTKPRVISLLLFTTVAAMFIAARGTPEWWLVLVVCVGGYFSAGAANAFNMVVERDLDVAMERTSSRPTVTHVISSRAALVFAGVSAVGSFVLLWVGASPLAAWMSLCGLLCYVFVYTLWLKRRTWQNIVIGGAAGAFPPLVGYAAVTGDLSPFAWFLFALIFTWTPVHFWALAILIKDDYAKAGVPMLPVVKGDEATVLQIGLYGVITVLLCGVPLVQGQAGWVYGLGAGLLNLGLLAQCASLFREKSKPRARSLFKYSMVYLALIFMVIAVDRVVGV